MNFFERQNQARRKTELLLFYFVPAVILIIAAGYCAVTLLFSVFGYLHGAQFPTMSRHGMYHVWHGHLELLLWVSGGTLLIILFGCVSKMSELADGGPALANSMDARWIQPG